MQRDGRVGGSAGKPNPPPERLAVLFTGTVLVVDYTEYVLLTML